ncbi:zeta toxin family protein [Photobacterium leiognathi]|uniref:zeta toxin family protein n=1 Tax=Photobacterium leiognathi TaxID=553611 RepID=UPI00298171B5|nr:zeta toxin family protein [Photobacterium leiognathi]
MNTYSRPLHDNQLAYDFLTRALGYTNTLEVGDHVQRIVTAEKLLQSTTAEPTLSDKKNRHTFYYTDEKRRQLREKIFLELVFEKRLPSDDDICLGRGGALPENVKNEGKAYIIIGLPASGKSTIAEKVADKYHAALVDSDLAKRKLPEFSLPQGASIVHAESSQITFGSDDEGNDEPSVYEYFTKNRTNIVIPKIGQDVDSVLALRDSLLEESEYKYDEVHLILVSVDRKESTKRALARFLKTNRYVPLSLVFDVYANDPTLTYYRVRDCDKWTSTGKVTTDGPTPKYVAGSTEDNPVNILFGGVNEK